jgi:hypothetical protein
MPGGLLQLAAYGPQDVYLTGNPEITFFIAIYKRYTNFAIESIQQMFHGDANFGNTVYCDIEPNADLVHQIFLNIRLPNLNTEPENNPDYTVSWVNGIGHAIIRYVDIEIGGQIIDRHFGQWLEIWSELTIKSEKEYAYNLMVGKEPNFDTDSQPGPLNLYVPLQFWFNRYLGMALPLIALQYSKIRIIVAFREFDELWISSNGLQPGLGGNESSIVQGKSIIETSLWVDYIFLDNEERRKFSSSSLEYLIEQLQVNTIGVDQRNVIIPMTFNNPVKELIWVLQTDKIYQLGANKSYEYFDFSNGEPIPGDTIDEATIRMEGQERFKKREPFVFRVLQPYQYHTRVPRNFIYVYSFCFEPEIHQPTGTCNFSKLDNASLELTLNKCVIQKNTQLNIYATSYNVLRIESGIAGLRIDAGPLELDVDEEVEVPSKVIAVPSKVIAVPSKEKPPGTKIYGNFCGPQYCGGIKKLKAENNCDYSVEPIDELDACCKVHDQCCGDISTRGTNCNKEILNCAKNAKVSGLKAKFAKAAITASFALGQDSVCGDIAKDLINKVKNKIKNIF